MASHVVSDQQWNDIVEQAGASQKPIVFMYSATWCGPCKRIYPLFSQFANQLNGRVLFAKVDVDRAQQTAASQKVSSMPTFRCHYPTGYVTECKGANKEQLSALIEQMLKQCGIGSRPPKAFSESRRLGGAEEEQKDEADEKEERREERRESVNQDRQTMQQEYAQQQRQQYVQKYEKQQQQKVEEEEQWEEQQRKHQNYALEQQELEEQQRHYEQQQQVRQQRSKGSSSNGSGGGNGAPEYSIIDDRQWNEFAGSVHEAHMPLVLQFGRANHARCKSMDAVFRDAAQRFAGKCVFAKVDVDGAARVYEMLCKNSEQLQLPFYTAYDAAGNPIGQFSGARKSRFIGLVQKATGQYQ